MDAVPSPSRQPAVRSHLIKSVLTGVLLLGWSAVALGAPASVVYQIGFGAAADCAPGYLPVELKSADPRFFWKGQGLETRDRGGDDLLHRHFISGQQGEFTVRLDNGRYEVALTFGDRDYAHGPFCISAQGETVVERLTTARGEFVTKVFPVSVADEKLRIDIAVIDGGANFAVASMIIRGAEQHGEHSAPPPSPSKAVPTLAELEAGGQPDVAASLQRYCDWLLTHRTMSGSLNPNSAEWYRSAYPVRTLLAGYDIFGRQAYLDAVTVFLDKLVSEQLPNGAWSSGFADKPVARRSSQEIERAQGGTTNMADVGSISTCLAVAYPYVDDARKSRYRDALRRFADDYAARWQLPTGAFSNARWMGKDMHVPYSVATGTQGMSFCALYAITGEEKYLRIAEHAVRFLLENWQADGRPIHHHHALDQAEVVKVTSFGDVLYYHEAILWVWHWTADEALKEKIRQVYAWHINGPKGLLAARQQGVWWPLVDPWTNSKGAAMPLVLLEYDRSMQHDAEVAEAVRRATSLLCNPELAARLGILCDPELPWGEFSTTATGFGGLTLAELIRPGVIYLKSERARLPAVNRR